MTLSISISDFLKQILDKQVLEVSVKKAHKFNFFDSAEDYFSAQNGLDRPAWFLSALVRRYLYDFMDDIFEI